MSKQILNLDSLERTHADEQNGQIFHAENMLFTSTPRSSEPDWFKPNQPYRLEEARFFCIEGKVHSRVNLHEYHFEGRFAGYIPKYAVMEVLSVEDVHSIRFFSFLPQAQSWLGSSPMFIGADEKEWDTILMWLELIGLMVESGRNQQKAIEYAQHAMMESLFHKAEHGDANHSSSRPSELFNEFLQLLEQFGKTQSTIDFYADRLHISTNYLSIICRRESGRTVMEWINLYRVQQAKLLLRYEHMSAAQVAWHLHFSSPAFFSRFFHRETGITPKEYREGK